MSNYIRPQSLQEALGARRDHPDYTILAGGTDLLVAHNTRPVPSGLIDLFGLEVLTDINEDVNGAIRLGAAVTYRQLLASKVCQRELPALCAAAREVGALQIQARGTLAGNIQTSSPVGDTLPVLLALDAQIEVASHRGERRIEYGDFLTGYRQTALAADELITAIHIPPRHAGLVQYWRKMGTRRAQSISKVMLAGAAVVEAGVIHHVRLALGAVADRTIRAKGAENAVLGNAPNEQTAQAAHAAVVSEITPIDDIRSSASYRRTVAANVVARFIRSLE